MSATRLMPIVTLALAALPGAAHADTLNRWVQIGPNDTAVLRSISDAATTACPTASIDGVPVTLTQRDQQDATYFPVLMCEYFTPASQAYSHTTAIIDGQALKMPVANPRRIVVIGDTGCRLINGPTAASVDQDCNVANPNGDVQAFPLVGISALVRSLQPDLIIHTGDFYYREFPCPGTAATGSAGCAGSAYGDNWYAWQQDWFQPAAAMMAVAPMALTRGNHEGCSRGAQGWFHYLDVFPYAQSNVTCIAGSDADFEAPYIVRAGTVQYLMFDNSYANSNRAPTDTSDLSKCTRTIPNATPPYSNSIAAACPVKVNPRAPSSSSVPEVNAVSVYQAQLAAILPSLSNAIFVTHKPVFGIAAAPSATGQVVGGIPDLQALFQAGVPAPIKMFLSGHIHNVEAVQFDNANFAPQFVIGNSGTQRDNVFAPNSLAGDTYVSATLNGTTPGTQTLSITRTYDHGEFGFAEFDAAPGGYTAQTWNLDATPRGRCTILLSARRVACSQ